MTESLSRQPRIHECFTSVDGPITLHEYQETQEGHVPQTYFEAHIKLEGRDLVIDLDTGFTADPKTLRLIEEAPIGLMSLNQIRSFLNLGNLKSNDRTRNCGNLEQSRYRVYVQTKGQPMISIATLETQEQLVLRLIRSTQEGREYVFEEFNLPSLLPQPDSEQRPVKLLKPNPNTLSITDLPRELSYLITKEVGLEKRPNTKIFFEYLIVDPEGSLIVIFSNSDQNLDYRECTSEYVIPVQLSVGSILSPARRFPALGLTPANPLDIDECTICRVSEISDSQVNTFALRLCDSNIIEVLLTALRTHIPENLQFIDEINQALGRIQQRLEPN